MILIGAGLLMLKEGGRAKLCWVTDEIDAALVALDVGDHRAHKVRQVKAIVVRGTAEAADVGVAKRSAVACVTVCVSVVIVPYTLVSNAHLERQFD